MPSGSAVVGGFWNSDASAERLGIMPYWLRLLLLKMTNQLSPSAKPTTGRREMTPEEIVGDWFEDALFRDALPHSYDRMVRDVSAAVEAERKRYNVGKCEKCWHVRRPEAIGWLSAL